ncbi:double zinc ribbon domain-containing protein [Wukongibacter sp. M2B1]|uniref:double zinc ribbon domain-containing protein n=1 Tax=Wukongibacter sp. M2B1 TaxID=3088895 RepID=UPI003D7A67FC
MSFFDKLKKGASEAGEKAKIMIEINKVKVQIFQTEKELKDEFKTIGETTFELYKKGNFDKLLESIEENCNNCLKKLEEIKELELEIKEINDGKKCPDCNKDVSYDTKFCYYCGYKFKVKDYKEELMNDTLICRNCNANLDKGSKFCANCGEEIN